ncbi:MAG: T9SS type A sorting domain-containing protein [Bacteroidales bacterium]
MNKIYLLSVFKRSLGSIAFLTITTVTMAQWSSTLNPYSQSAEATAMAIDESGNIYSLGYAYKNSTEKENYLLVKYTPSGEIAWTKTCNIEAEDKAWSIAIESSGNILVAGSSYRSGTNKDIAIIRYSSTGDSLGCYFYDGVNHLDDNVSNVLCESQNNIYFCGSTSFQGSLSGMVIGKLNENLEKQWTRTYNADFYNGVTTDLFYSANLQRVGITGYLKDYSGWAIMGTAIYDDAGNLQWSKSLRVDVEKPSLGYSLIINSDGSTYVCGYITHNSGWDAALVKFNSTGDTLWTSCIMAGESSFAYFNAQTTDATGNIYLTGMRGNNLLIAKINSDGDVMWSKEQPSGTFDKREMRYNIKLNSEGNIFVLGRSPLASGSTNIMLLKYSPEGELIWQKNYKHLDNFNDAPMSMLLDDSGNIFANATSTSASYYPEMTTFMLTGSAPSSISTNTEEKLNMYPNPANGKTWINAKHTGKATLQVFSIDGRLKHADTMINDDYELLLNGYQRGLYIVKVTAEGFTSSSLLMVQ